MITEYKILTATYLNELAKSVNHYIEQGWQPLGGVSGSHGGGKASVPGGFFQAIVKVDDNQ